ncbi:hypothetical protein fugu_004607 [Takifugu bimaculatus]|uniref:Protein phosphatase 1 regulatory subunit 15A/B C-terminal domain-containing protein n=1 Tax=Takifugu bimaculatus TaxID=433685 RepID=A0A4Z2B7P4_9TELE|nr:hypothetical protein fugu_004607 [Takifugu bimaculatus]
MFRSFLGDENVSGRQPLTSEAAQGLPSSGLRSQESPWIGVLSRPPLSFLHRCVTGRPRTLALCDDWAGSMTTSCWSEENAFFLQLDDMIPVTQTASNLSQLQCLFNGTTAANTSPFQGTGELGPEVCQDRRSTRSSSRTFFSRVWSTSQEMNLAALRTWVPETRAGGARWWTRSWGGSGASAKCLLSDVSHIQDGDLTAPLSKPKAPAVFIQSRWILGESAGPTSYKGVKFNSGALHTVQNVEGALLNQSGSGLGPVTLDQDNGYSSLEEEHFQISCLHMLPELLVAPPEAESPTVQSIQDQEDTSEEADPSVAEDTAAQAECDSFTLPKCQNKAIAFIMGCPCSDDDDDDGGSSQSDVEFSDDEEEEEDDGFDSEGSSSLSESSGDDESEVELDPEHLWGSLCHNMDPYNPLNFMAQLQTRTLPQTVTVPSPPQSSPDTLPCLTSLPDPQPSSDSWDDSSSASDADEAENHRLWTSFSTCLDPYSPLNFQATLRTREPGQAGTGSRTTEASHAHTSTSPKDEPAESPESGSRALRQSRRTIKKVRFCEHVDEVVIGAEEEEDRRGPWEELARDRCRFLRRCQEVEQSIAYCLQPQHRRAVYHRLSGVCHHDT